MTFMMTSSNDDKCDICHFFYQELSILSTQYMYKISCKMDKRFLRYSMFYQRGPTRQKSVVVNRISSLLDLEKKKVVFNAVIKCHFRYCPLIWIFSSRRSSKLINQIHEMQVQV